MERQTKLSKYGMLSSQMGSRHVGGIRVFVLFLLSAPPSSSPYLHRYFFYPSHIRKREGNFPALAAADFSGLCVQCACVFPPLISVLPTDNLAITSQGGSMELMLKLVVFFFFFTLFKLQWVMRQRGRQEGEGEP